MSSPQLSDTAKAVLAEFRRLYALPEERVCIDQLRSVITKDGCQSRRQVRHLLKTLFRDARADYATMRKKLFKNIYKAVDAAPGPDGKEWLELFLIGFFIKTPYGTPRTVNPLSVCCGKSFTTVDRAQLVSRGFVVKVRGIGIHLTEYGFDILNKVFDNDIPGWKYEEPEAPPTCPAEVARAMEEDAASTAVAERVVVAEPVAHHLPPAPPVMEPTGSMETDEAFVLHKAVAAIEFGTSKLIPRDEANFIIRQLSLMMQSRIHERTHHG